MNITSRLGRAGGIAAIAVAIGVGSVGLAGAASAAPVTPAGNPTNGPVAGCVFQTVNGHYLTAVGGGGRTTDVIHSDATHLLGWEMFTLNSLGGGVYDIQTLDGHYVTAVGGGGRTTDTIHTDATRVGAWEKFTVSCGH
jgi:hypothetical protein